MSVDDIKVEVDNLQKENKFAEIFEVLSKVLENPLSLSATTSRDTFCCRFSMRKTPEYSGDMRARVITWWLF